jgi:hypothetical protein
VLDANFFKHSTITINLNSTKDWDVSFCHRWSLEGNCLEAQQQTKTLLNASITLCLYEFMTIHNFHNSCLHSFVRDVIEFVSQASLSLSHIREVKQKGIKKRP